jgi:hypothetical protein
LSTLTTLQAGFNNIVSKGGVNCNFIYLDKVLGSVWDDDVSLSLGSSLWASGVIFPLNGTNSSKDFVLVEQGLLRPNDLKLYVSGGVDFNMYAGSDMMKIQIGSPSGDKYFVIPEGVQSWGVTNTSIFKKAYIRRLQLGSFLGEA